MSKQPCSHNELVIYYLYSRPLFHLRQFAVCVQFLVYFSHAWIILSLAYKSASQWFRWRGRSFINKKNSVDPGIEPWGMPDNSSKNSDIPSSLFID